MWIVGLGGALGCEVPRPALSFEPVDAGDDEPSDDAPSDDPADADDDRDPELPASRDASTPGKDAGDAGDAGRRDGGSGAPDAGPSQDAAGSALAGDYWMRTEGSAEQRLELLGGLGDVTLDTRRVAYALVRVSGSGSALTLTDQQCAVTLEQRCVTGCESITTTPRDAVTSSRAFAAATRKLEVRADGTWSASAVPFAVGFQANYNSDPKAVLPTRDGDPLSYDPDGGGEGVDWTSRMRLAVLTSTCTMRLAQRVDVSYGGTLMNGALASGTVTEHGSAQSVLSLSSSCSSGRADAVATAPKTLRLVRNAIPVSGTAWTCPTLAELEAAFR